MTILAAENLTIDFGGVRAVDGVSFAVNKAEIFAIIGPNGAGKTTLFNLISGIYPPKSGRVHLGGDDVTHKPVHTLAARGLSRTFQNMQIFFRMSAIENVMVGRHLHERRNLFAHLCMLPSVVRQNDGDAPESRGIARAGGPARSRRPAGRAPCLMARSSGLKSRAPWRPSRRCCCSTSRRRAAMRWKPRRSMP